MATYIKTLKEDNGDITYPQTKASAVLLTNNSDLETELAKYVTAEEIATTSALTPPVQTSMIADGAVTTAKINNGAVTAAKIDWSTINAITVPFGPGFTDTQIAANAVFPISYKFDSVGTGFSISSNTVVVGAGISKVLVSVQVFYVPRSGANNYAWFQLQKNGINLEGARTITNMYGSSFSTATLAEFMVTVSQGDAFRVVNLDNASYRQGNSFMTIRQIA